MVRKVDNSILKYLIAENSLNDFTVIVHKLIHDENHQLVTVAVIEIC